MLHRKVPVHTLQLESSFLNFKMFHFKNKVHKKATLFDKKALEMLLIYQTTFVLSARNHGCTGMYKLRSLDVELK